MLHELHVFAIGFAIAGSGVCACRDTCPSPSCDANAAGVTSVVYVGSDYSSSLIGALPLDGSPASFACGTQLGTDPVLASSHGRRFYIARELDTFFEANGCGVSITAPLSTRAPNEASDTTSVNAQDLAVAPDGSLWVARLGLIGAAPVPSILITGNATPATLDLSALDSDGNPDPSSIRIIGTRAFVTLDRLIDGQSTQPSEMAILDTTTRSLVASPMLAGRNPFGLMKESADGSTLWLAEPGNFFDATETDAGIEVFDTNAMTSTLILKESDLGASVIEVAPSPDGTCGVAILADPSTSNNTSLISFSIDPATHAASNVTTIIPTTPGFFLRGLFWATKTLLVADQRAGSNGFPVHVFTAQTANVNCALTASSDLFVETVPALAFSN